MMQSSFQIDQYEFSEIGLESIKDEHLARNLWPMVYILHGGEKEQAYIGESTNIISRISNHLSNDVKNKLSSLKLISSGKFNKSAALDIEAKLISYMAADGKFEILNGNLGIANHNYYQKNELYKGMFEQIWDKLRSKNIAEHSILQLNNSDIFKYSPYKSLSLEQEQGLLNILKCLLDKNYRNVVVEGGAGTGKTILAIYLFKLLMSNDLIYSEELNDSTTSILKSYVDKFKKAHQRPKMALVVPMSSFRSTLKKAFRNINGLSDKMVIGPSDVAKSNYDLLVVDESHRLRRRVNLGSYFGQFDKNCNALGFNKDTSDELDWVLKNSDKSILFYDNQQSIKPSDVLPEKFLQLKSNPSTIVTTLKSQFRSQGGNRYSEFVNCIFSGDLKTSETFSHPDYEFSLYESLSEMVSDIKNRDSRYGLSRLVAGYAWPWISKNDKSIYDIEIDDIKLRWNSTNDDWINSKNASDEVGCIHTTQGYDLNYTGVIFGSEITYNPSTKQIEIIEENYCDRNGKQSIKDPIQLKEFIINIYKTILLRGIKGTYIYVCDHNLRSYLARHIKVITNNKKPLQKIKFLQNREVKPFVNSIPLYELRAAAGGFSDPQAIDDIKWIEAPQGITLTQNLFACYVSGESMNKVIPNGALCLFRANPVGSKNGKIVLVQHHGIDDPDNGGSYTVKTYYSDKQHHDGEIVNYRITLQPETNSEGYSPIVLDNDEGLRVVAEFIQVLQEP